MDQRDLSAIESTIWDMANKLRGQMDASEYKNYILAFMFYRFLSEKQNRYLVKEELVTPEPGQSPAFVIMDELFGTEDLTKIREYAVQSNSFTRLDCTGKKLVRMARLSETAMATQSWCQ